MQIDCKFSYLWRTVVANLRSHLFLGDQSVVHDSVGKVTTCHKGNDA